MRLFVRSDCGEVKAMSGDDLRGGGDAEEETDIERARIAQRLIAGVRGLPPQEERAALDVVAACGFLRSPSASPTSTRQPS
ncbi:hypothetical protein ASD08_15150 [Streptomyces sp. Root369]|nr:hypothetical protein ASD08_15150 [Streptomyces sp. Root369]